MVGSRAVISSTFTAVPLAVEPLTVEPLTAEAVVEPQDIPEPSTEPAPKTPIAESVRELFDSFPPLDQNASPRPLELPPLARSESKLSRQQSIALAALPRATQVIDRPIDPPITRTEVPSVERQPVETKPVTERRKQPVRPVPLPRTGPQPVELPDEPVEEVSQPTPAAAPQSVGTTETTPARSLQNPSPLYPADAVRRGIEGVVTLRVTIGANGLVKSVEIARSSGHRILDNSALDAVRNWEFDPASREDKPVEWTARLPIRFRLN